MAGFFFVCLFVFFLPDGTGISRVGPSYLESDFLNLKKELKLKCVNLEKASIVSKWQGRYCVSMGECCCFCWVEKRITGWFSMDFLGFTGFEPSFTGFYWALLGLTGLNLVLLGFAGFDWV